MGKRKVRKRKAPSPAPQPRPRPLPEDSIQDILLRLPPDDPAGLVRASAACKAWRRIITDPSFHGRYRALHPTAPVLGFLHRPMDPDLPRFVSTTSFRPAAADHQQHPLDCRHGRAVFYDYSDSVVFNGVSGGYVVWDPATGEQHKVPDVLGGDFLPHPTVICAAGEGCDHRGCGGGPFIVAFVGLEVIDEMDDYDDDDDDDETTKDDDYGGFKDAHACFYASDTGEVAGQIHVHLGPCQYHLDPDRPAAQVGDSLYYLCWPGGILRYRYGLLRRLGGMRLGGIRGMRGERIREGDVLSMMELPSWERFGIGKNADVLVMEAEGGGLGLACLSPKTGTKLYLLAREAEGPVGDDAAGSGQWVQRRVIDLKMLLPRRPKRMMAIDFIGVDFIGVAQDANVIFVSRDDGVFSIDLGRSSLQTRKVCKMGVVDRWMYPFVSFYTESLLLKLARGKLATPVGNQ